MIRRPLRVKEILRLIHEDNEKFCCWIICMGYAELYVTAMNINRNLFRYYGEERKLLGDIYNQLILIMSRRIEDGDYLREFEENIKKGVGNKIYTFSKK